MKTVEGSNPQIEALCKLPEGKLFYYAKGNGTHNMERLKIRTPKFINLPFRISLVAWLPIGGCAD